MKNFNIVRIDMFGSLSPYKKVVYILKEYDDIKAPTDPTPYDNSEEFMAR